MLKKNIGIKNDSKNTKIFIMIGGILIIVLIIVLISTGSLSNLMGDSVTDYYCEDDSYTLKGSKCEKEIKEKAILLGDLNGDEKVTQEDLKIMETYVDRFFEEDNPEFTEEQILAADISKDDEIFDNDLTLFKEYFGGTDSNGNVYSDTIGVERNCKLGYTLNGVWCTKKDIVDAKQKIQESNVEIDNDSSNNIQPVVIRFKTDQTDLSVSRDKVVNIDVDFDIKDSSKDYYYRWRTYNEGKFWVEGNCNKVTSILSEHRKTLTISNKTPVRKGTITVYDDSECKNASKNVPVAETETYQCLDCGDFKVTIDSDASELQKSGSVVKNNVKFNIYNNKLTYYYRWRTYNKKKLLVEGNCIKMPVNDTHVKELTINEELQKRMGTITVYSDSKCKNEVTTISSKTYTCSNCTNVVNVSFKPQDNETTISKNVDYKIDVDFDINDTEKQYYYKWSTYTYGKNTYNSNCQEVKDGTSLKTLTMNGDRYGIISIYSDSSCANRIKSVQTKLYTCKNCTNQVNVKYRYDKKSDTGYQPTHYMYGDRKIYLNDGTVKYYHRDDNSYLNVPKNLIYGNNYSNDDDELANYIKVKTYREIYNNMDYYNTEKAVYDESGSKPELKNYKSIDRDSLFDTAAIGVSFEINDTTKQYYYTWETYDHYGKKSYISSCQKVNSNESIKSLTMKGNRYGSVSIYYDSACKNKIKTTNTKKLNMLLLNKCYGNCSEEQKFPGAYASVSQFEKLTGESGYTFTSNNTSTVVKKGTKVTVRGKIEIINYKKQYYYRWVLRNLDGSGGNYLSKCTKAQDNKIISTTATIDSNSATVNLMVYDSSKCDSFKVSDDYRSFVTTTTCKSTISNPIYSRNDAFSKYYYLDCNPYRKDAS